MNTIQKIQDEIDYYNDLIEHCNNEMKSNENAPLSIAYLSFSLNTYNRSKSLLIDIKEQLLKYEEFFDEFQITVNTYEDDEYDSSDAWDSVYDKFKSL